jgi:hypothetical protein
MSREVFILLTKSAPWINSYSITVRAVSDLLSKWRTFVCRNAVPLRNIDQCLMIIAAISVTVECETDVSNDFFRVNTNFICMAVE